MRGPEYNTKHDSSKHGTNSGLCDRFWVPVTSPFLPLPTPTRFWSRASATHAHETVSLEVYGTGVGMLYLTRLVQVDVELRQS